MIDWLIIGGGIHGTVVANALLQLGRAHLDDIAIVDPEPLPLEAWYRRVAQCGMRFLRSPAAHGVLPDFTSLLRWGASHGFSRSDHTIPPYARPSVELFAAHAQAALNATGITSRYRADSVVGVEPTERSWIASTASGTNYEARNVVLALGRGTATSTLRVPEWAAPGKRLPVSHVFDPSFSREQLDAAVAPVVIGGGVSAAHLALALSHGDKRVTLVARSQLREEQFDSDPCYIGPKCYERYIGIANPDERRAVLRDVRNPGSIPPDLMNELGAAHERGTIEVVIDEIIGANGSPDDSTGASLPNRVELRGRRGTYTSDGCVLATGFRDQTPGEPLLREIEKSIRAMKCVSGRNVERVTGHQALRRDVAGRPIPAPSLEWAPGLFVTGILAEQELGPTAANIVGAHNAAKRIISGTVGEPWRVPRSWKSYAPDTASSSSGVL